MEKGRMGFAIKKEPKEECVLAKMEAKGDSNTWVPQGVPGSGKQALPRTRIKRTA